LAVRSNQPERTFINAARRAQIIEATLATIAEAGYSRTSLARIAAKLGISKGIISYHFSGKDELIAEVLSYIVQQHWAYMLPRITEQTTGADVLRTYIESNLAYMRENRTQVITLAEIRRSDLAPDGPHRFPFHTGDDRAVKILQELLSRFQASGELRADFDPRAVAIAIRAAIDAVPPRLVRDPELDIDHYAREVATIFDLATCVES
jgi:AcrR family transcriptional regulator